jgi:hypothetical protein
MVIKEFKSLTKGAARLFDLGRTMGQMSRDGNTPAPEKSLITMNKADEAVKRNMALAMQILLKKNGNNRFEFSTGGKSGCRSVIIKVKDRNNDKSRYYKVSKKRRGD